MEKVLFDNSIYENSVDDVAFTAIFNSTKPILVEDLITEGVLGDKARIYVLGSGFNLALNLHKTHWRIFIIVYTTDMEKNSLNLLKNFPPCKEANPEGATFIEI